MFCLDQTFEWYEDACNVRKRYLNVSDFHHCYGNFFESAILKVTRSQFIQSSLSTMVRYIDNRILKDTLKLKILRTWIKILANSFIKTQFLNLTQSLLTYRTAFVTDYLYTYLLIIDILRSMKFIHCLDAFFIKTSKILMRFNILFSKFSASKYSYYVLFSMKHLYLLTAKITRNNSL